jgi:hypothetical protein
VAGGKQPGGFGYFLGRKLDYPVDEPFDFSRGGVACVTASDTRGVLRFLIFKQGKALTTRHADTPFGGTRVVVRAVSYRTCAAHTSG